MEGDKTKINFTSLLTQLKAELPARPINKPKVEKIFYTTEAQKRLLNVCGFIDFLNPPWFSSAAEVNEFVTNFVNKRTAFENEHKTLPCPGMYHFEGFFFFLFLTLIYSILVLTILLLQVT